MGMQAVGEGIVMGIPSGGMMLGEPQDLSHFSHVMNSSHMLSQMAQSNMPQLQGQMAPSPKSSEREKAYSDLSSLQKQE